MVALLLPSVCAESDGKAADGVLDLVSVVTEVLTLALLTVSATDAGGETMAAIGSEF